MGFAPDVAVWTYRWCELWLDPPVLKVGIEDGAHIGSEKYALIQLDGCSVHARYRSCVCVCVCAGCLD